ncbi:UNVERIFIED_CONTAM: hypothetical protein FKN15_044908 [Acipenser sinensis]
MLRDDSPMLEHMEQLLAELGPGEDLLDLEEDHPLENIDDDFVESSDDEAMEQMQDKGWQYATIRLICVVHYITYQCVPDRDKASLLDAPVTPGHTFYPAVDKLLKWSQQVRESTKELPKKVQRPQTCTSMVTRGAPDTSSPLWGPQCSEVPRPTGDIAASIAALCRLRGCRRNLP